MSFRLSATKTPENAEENKAFENGFESGKRSFSSVDNRNRRILKAEIHIPSFPQALSGVEVSTIAENASKSMCFVDRLKTTENGSV